MDKLAKRLRDDAEKIDVAVSTELEKRIEASLRGTPQNNEPAEARRRTRFSWWASGLTGAAAVALLVFVDTRQSAPDFEPGLGEPPLQTLLVPEFDWKPKQAIFTESLQQELADIESDLRKAEQAVMKDLNGVSIQPNSGQTPDARDQGSL